MDPENTDGVIDPESQSGETETQTPEDRSGVDSAGSGEKENRIPYSRVKEMIAREREKALQEFREKEYAPLKSQFEEHSRKVTEAELARMKAMGWLKEEQPKPVTHEDLDKYWSEREKKLEEKQLQLYHAQRIQDGWEAVRAKHAGLSKMKSFQDSVMARYVNNPRVGFVEHAEAVAKEYEAYYAEKESAAAKEREEQVRPDRRVVPSGRGAGGGGAKNSGGKKKTVAERLADSLRSRGE